MISVIIPVYNSALYIQKAIESVLEQPEDIEIVIVDDGSTDSSLIICKKIATNNKKIKVFQHPDKKNHGRSASRNLGIENANGKFIAFLDADDYYLPNRFVNDLKLLEDDESVDGVYNAISAHFYREYTLRERDRFSLTTIREEIPPEKLFEKMMPIGNCGYFSGIGLTVRKNIFEKTGYFNEDLEVAEDTELWIKFALVSNLKAGIINQAVSMRGVHNRNVSFRNDALYLSNNLKMYDLLLNWSFENDISISRIDKIWKKVWNNRTLNKTGFNSDMFFWTKSVSKYPRLLFLRRTYKSFPPFKKIKNILNV